MVSGGSGCGAASLKRRQPTEGGAWFNASRVDEEFIVLRFDVATQ
jgi:hypothetical protein